MILAQVSVSILGETASTSSVITVFSDCDVDIELEGQVVFKLPLDDSLCDPWQTSAKLSVAVGVLALGLFCSSKSIYKSGGSLGHWVIAAAVAVICYFIKSNMSDTFNSSSSEAGAGNTTLSSLVLYFILFFEIHFEARLSHLKAHTHPPGFSVALGLCIAYGVIAGLQFLVVASDFCGNTQRSSGYMPLANSSGSIQTSGNNSTLPVYAPQPAAAPQVRTFLLLNQARTTLVAFSTAN